MDVTHNWVTTKWVEKFSSESYRQGLGGDRLKIAGGGGGVGLVHDQNRGKVYKNAGSGSCHFRKGQAGKGWGTKEECQSYKRPIK